MRASPGPTAFVAAAASLGFLVTCLSAPPAAAAVQSWTRTDFTLPSWDGTNLDATVWVPNAQGPFPAIIVTNGWNHRHDQAVELRFSERLAGQGYVVLGYTSRGWGNSAGEVELDGPKEQNDTIAVLEYLVAKAAEWKVQLDAPGDPRVGMVGESYAGAIQFLVAQKDGRIDAIVPRITWSNLLESLAPSDVFKVGWVSELYATGQTVSRGAPVPGQYPGEPDASGPSPTLTQWYADAWANNGPTAAMRHDIGVVRSLTPGALTTPTLLIQGWGDTLFEPNQALTTFHDLTARDVPVRLVLYPGGHGQSLPEETPASRTVEAAMDDWFNVTLRGKVPTLPPYPVLRYRPAYEDYAGEMQWPPAGTRTWTGYLAAPGTDGLVEKVPAGASTTLTNPVVPGSCVDVPSFQPQAAFCPYTIPESTAVWSGPALAADTEITGEPRVRLMVSSTQPSDVRLFVTLLDVDSAGKATPVWRQATPVRLAGANATAADIRLQATSWTFEAGHRIGLQVAASDAAFFPSREAGRITISTSPEAASWLTVPIVPKDAWGDKTAPRLELVRAAPGAVWVKASDDLALANVTSDIGPGKPFDVRRVATAPSHTSATQWDVLFEAPANATVRITARDMAGNAKSLTVLVPEDSPPAGRCSKFVGCETWTPSPSSDTPGLGALAIVLVMAAAALARRR